MLRKSLIFNLSKSSFSKWLANEIFFLANFICVIGIFIPSIRGGVFCSIVILIVLILNGKCINILFNDIPFAVYLLSCILSSISYTYNDRPFSIFIAALSYNFIPSMLYLVGAYLAKTDSHLLGKISHKVLMSCIFLLAFGLFFYIVTPEYYYSRIGDSLETYTWGTKDYRFGSYLSSLNVGSVCVACIPLILQNIQYEKNRIKNILYIFIVAISFILCMQRGAWLSAVILLFLIFISANMKLKKKLVIICTTCLLIAFIYLFRNSIFTMDQISFFNIRIKQTNIKSMFSTRVYQWKGAFEIFIDNPWGYGLGSLSHKAVPYGLSLINDGNYLRILSETGIISFISFVYLNIRGIIRSNVKHTYLSFLLIGFCIQALGTNVFDLFFSSFIYWFFLGFSNYYQVNRRIELC